MEYICNEKKRECVHAQSPPEVAALALFTMALSKELSPGGEWMRLNNFLKACRRWWRRDGVVLTAGSALPDGFTDITDVVVSGIEEFYKMKTPEWGEFRFIFNLDKCEYVSADYAYDEVKRLVQGARDWSEWADTGALEFAVLLGATPQVPSPLGFYERYWGRWARDRMLVVGDRTNEFNRIAETCSWVDLTLNVNIATAEVFMHLALQSGEKKYRDLAVWVLRRVHQVTTSATPEDYAVSIAKKVVETGSYRRAYREYVGFMTSEHLKWCARVVDKLDVPFRPVYIGEGCLQPSYDRMIHVLDAVRPFEALFAQRRRKFR